MENIKSYAYDNKIIKNGWEGWEKEYSKSLKDEVFDENKRRNSCGGVYCDPDKGNIEYYTQICHFLNSQEQKIIKENKRYHYCTGNYNEKARINVCKNGKFIFCLKSDQFGFSAPTYKNKNTHPYGVYYNGADDKEEAIANIVKWVYITRTIGGSFLWPEVKGTSYNIYRGGSIPRDNRRYMQDRVDLALLEVSHFFSDNYEQYKNDMLYRQIKKENTHMKEWLEHFGSFETFVTYFKFDDFVEKKDGVIDGVKSIIDGKKLNDKGRENCELPQDSEGLYKVLDRITDMIYKRTNKMEEILKPFNNKIIKKVNIICLTKS